MMRLAGALALASIVALGWLLVRYEGARETWRARGSAIGTAAYDANASDAAYHEVDGAFEWVARGARAAALLIVAAGIASGRARPRRRRSEHSGARRVGARAIDLATLLVALASTRITTSSPGVTECLDWLVPASVLAIVLGAAANGATLGDRVIG